jgi:hypothetical protein
MVDNRAAMVEVFIAIPFAQSGDKRKAAAPKGTPPPCILRSDPEDQNS